MAMSTTDCHRNMCQLLLDHGVFSEDELLEQLGESIERHKRDIADKRESKRLKLHHEEQRDLKTLAAVIEHINEQIEPFGMKVARMKSQTSGTWQVYYGVVNLAEEDGFKQEWLSKSEQEFFHLLVGEIIGSDSKQIESSEAAALGRDLSQTKLSAAEAHRCLERLELGQWLAKSDDGHYSLGVRTELQRRYMAASEPASVPSSNTQELE